MVKIFVDARELRNQATRFLYEKGVEIETPRLEVGDFILSEDVVAELKKVDDFVASLIDGRLFSQAKNLRDNFKKPIFIIEGDFSSIYEVRNVHPNAIRCALLSLTLDYQIPVLFAQGPEETADILYEIARREQETNNKEIALRGSRKSFSLPEQQQYIVEGFPCIGPKLAKNLLQHFGSCSAIFNATEEQLKEVEKVGKKKAATIRELLEKEYKNSDDV